MYDTVLMPIDKSDLMQPVVEDAAELTTERDTAVFLLYIVGERTFLMLADKHVDEVCERLRSQNEATLTEAAETMAEYGVGTVTELHRGDPTEEILAFAEGIDAALISMGTHTRFEDNIFGSVSQSVIVQSKVSVLAIPIEQQ